MSAALKKIGETPKGELEWVIIRGQGKEDLQGNFKYQATLVLDPENNPEHKAFVESIEDYWEENKPSHIANAKSMGIYPHKVASGEADENGKPIYVESGKVMVLFKTGTEYADGKNKVVKVFNAKNKEVEIGETKIGNGSVGRLSGAVDIYEVRGKGKNAKAVEAGVTFYLDAVKIVKMKEFVSGPQFSADDSDEDDSWSGDEGETWTGDETKVDAAQIRL